ncbi:MAG: hypothetical protein RIS47_1923 [Bacteroidota bacterium]
MKIRYFYSLLAAVLLLFQFQCAPKSSSLSEIPGGVELSTATQTIRLQFFTDNTVRVQKWLVGTQPDSSSLVVLAKPVADLKIQTNQTDSTITLSSAAMQVSVNKKTGVVSYTDLQNKALLSEAKSASIEPVALPEEKAYTIRQEFSLDPSEGIYGLGQHQDGYMNYRGKEVVLVQTNTDAVIPVLVSTKGYGILWDNYSKTVFNDTPEAASLQSLVAGNIDYYFMLGANIDGVIAQYRGLTGVAPMYGKYAYGYWQSKEHYDTQDELLAVAREYRSRKIPIDNMIQDWDYWDGNPNWSQMFFDLKKFPTPTAMMDELHKSNFHAIISIWSGFGQNTPIYKEMEQNGYLYPTVGWAQFRYYDAYNPAACELYWQHNSKGLYAHGLDGWWMDSTEPDIVNALTKEATEYEMTRVGKNHLGSFAKYLNTYSLMSVEGVYKNQLKENPNKRVYILTRSTFAGQQRSAATTWSGDIGADWSIYRNQISAGLNHCMAGVPYWTFDIGGFVIGSYEGVFCYGGKDPAYQELYTRMFQFGAFCPIFRSHGSETPREIWQFGKFQPTLLKFDNLRYRLMPYIYSLAHQVTAKGYTIMRGLPMDFANDPKTYNIDDQFMFGPAIMACPVTNYMYNRPPEKSVLLPAASLQTADGKPGITATYFTDSQLKQQVKQEVVPQIDLSWYGGRPSFVTDSAHSIRWEGKLIPTETGKHQFHLKAFGTKRIFLNGKQLNYTYQSVEVYTEFVELKAGTSYDLRIESESKGLGAYKMLLFWRTPSMLAKEKLPVPNIAKTREVYLPAGTQWFDFWTGQSLKGGQTITADAPIDKIPVYVKAGSIVPMGPFVQYATEKPEAPIELRIYRGANGTFTYYEDENDNNDY